MPQLKKGGKFVFGRSRIGADGRVQFPTQAVEEYRIAGEGKVYLFTGSKVTGGFCVTRKGLLQPSKLGHILEDMPPCGSIGRLRGLLPPIRAGFTAGCPFRRRGRSG